MSLSEVLLNSQRNNAHIAKLPLQMGSFAYIVCFALKCFNANVTHVISAVYSNSESFRTRILYTIRPSPSSLFLNGIIQRPFPTAPLQRLPQTLVQPSPSILMMKVVIGVRENWPSESCSCVFWAGLSHVLCWAIGPANPIVTVIQAPDHQGHLSTLNIMNDLYIFNHLTRVKWIYVFFHNHNCADSLNHCVWSTTDGWNIILQSENL